MPSSKATGVYGRSPQGVRGEVHAISRARRWLNRIVLASGLVLVGAGLYQGSTTLGAQQVERLTVRGDVRHLDNEAIQARLAPRVADGFMAADLIDLRQELESLPWVYEVNTRRLWPAEIEVTLVEQRPLARWGESGYLNHEGEYFAADPDPLYAHLPKLTGPSGTEVSLMRRYQMLADRLGSAGLSITALLLDALEQLTVKFDNGLSLLLGAQRISQRAARFVRLWSAELPQRAVATVDLRYEHGAAVTFSDKGLAMQATVNGGEEQWPTPTINK